MQALVVHAHPIPGSYSHAIRDAAVAGLRSAGHAVHIVDLYELDYRPWMTDDEHRRYESIGGEHPDVQVAEHIALLRNADILVLVYPTWWAGLPTIMKGWLDRTMLPGVAFELDPKTNKVRGTLDLVHLVGITTYGSPAWYLRVFGDAGRRTVTRTIRLACRRSTRTTWRSLDQLDGRTDADRQRFLSEIEATCAALGTLAPSRIGFRR